MVGHQLPDTLKWFPQSDFTPRSDTEAGNNKIGFLYRAKRFVSSPVNDKV